MNRLIQLENKFAAIRNSIANYEKKRALLRGLTPDFRVIAQVIRAMSKDTTEASGIFITNEMSLQDKNGTGDDSSLKKPWKFQLQTLKLPRISQQRKRK